MSQRRRDRSNDLPVRNERFNLQGADDRHALRAPSPTMAVFNISAFAEGLRHLIIQCSN
jgi:hypothetical protein